MTRENEEFLVDGGPSKLDLMLSLFDTDMGMRTLKFHTPQWVHTHNTYELTVQITSARRRNPAATLWEIEGIVETPRYYKQENVRVSIYYLSDIREGRARFEEGSQTHGIMETPDDASRARALMIIIGRMVAIAQNHGDLPEEFYEQFEKAKPISWAKDHKSLTEAIKNI
ncbi:hypothetical protein IT398_00990 [Candidatus Nomurabacteria bacterium]|nr:hypothetical protein [Candidatus Nomurabacteria bacterium]